MEVSSWIIFSIPMEALNLLSWFSYDLSNFVCIVSRKLLRSSRSIDLIWSLNLVLSDFSNE